MYTESVIYSDVLPPSNIVLQIEPFKSYEILELSNIS